MSTSIKRILLGFSGLIVFIIGAGILYITMALPSVGPPPNITVAGTLDQVERGDYLANHVMVCMDCHSTRDWSQYGGPPIIGTLGRGGEEFNREMGFPGNFVAPNITLASLGSWTDGEIFRTITTGVSKDGRALFNVMPYHGYGKLAREDIEAVIAYLRTIPAQENDTPPADFDFPVNLIIKTVPQPASLQPRPDPSDRLAYGKYLVTAAACYDCHTEQKQGEFVGEDFAGGMEFNMPDGALLRSPNLTPHTSGLAGWTEERFVQRFKMYTDSAYVSPPVGPDQMQTLMPWTMYGGMTEQDLAAIFYYLQNLEPKDNEVVRYVLAKERLLTE
jgi:mono/diheme cytochrome c family protein